MATSHVEERRWPALPSQQLDLLFVIDDTTAMASYADRVGELADLVEQALETSRLSVRIAVTSNDGMLRYAPSSTPVLDLLLEYDFTRTTNFHGTLRDNLRSMLAVGSASTGPSRPLDAQRKVLEQDVHGFLRPRAYLMIVTVTAQDDASTVDPGEHAAWLKTLKQDPAAVVVTGIYAMPAPRLDAFYAAFPSRNVTVAIDEPDHSDAIELFLQLQKATLGLPCANASDVDPATPGPQFDCTFSAMIRGAERLLPQCQGEDDSFCWELLESSFCTTGLEPRIRPYDLNSFHPEIWSQCVVLY